MPKSSRQRTRASTRRERKVGRCTFRESISSLRSTPPLASEEPGEPLDEPCDSIGKRSPRWRSKLRCAFYTRRHCPNAKTRLSTSRRGNRNAAGRIIERSGDQLKQWQHPDQRGFAVPRVQARAGRQRQSSQRPSDEKATHGNPSLWITNSGNDPSAGSPTETLLRLLLPLNDQVWSSFQHTGATERPHRVSVRRPH